MTTTEPGGTYGGFTAHEWATAYARATQEKIEAINAIAARQQREADTTEHTTHYAIETDGQIKHETTTLGHALQAADLYDDAHLLTRKTPDWQRVTRAEAETP